MPERSPRPADRAAALDAALDRLEPDGTLRPAPEPADPELEAELGAWSRLLAQVQPALLEVEPPALDLAALTARALEGRGSIAADVVALPATAGSAPPARASQVPAGSRPSPWTWAAYALPLAAAVALVGVWALRASQRPEPAVSQAPASSARAKGAEDRRADAGSQAAEPAADEAAKSDGALEVAKVAERGSAPALPAAPAEAEPAADAAQAPAPSAVSAPPHAERGVVDAPGQGAVGAVTRGAGGGIAPTRAERPAARETATATASSQGAEPSEGGLSARIEAAHAQRRDGRCGLAVHSYRALLDEPLDARAESRVLAGLGLCLEVDGELAAAADRLRVAKERSPDVGAWIERERATTPRAPAAKARAAKKPGSAGASARE